MRGHIFRNMDGMTAQDFVSVFVDMLDKEKQSTVGILNFDFYRWEIGEHVFFRLKESIRKQYGLEEAERTVEGGKFLGIELKVSDYIHPDSVRLNKKPPQVYISTGGRGYGKSFMADLMKHTHHEDFLDSMRYSVGFLHSKEDNMNYNIKDVIFSGPCTIVLWGDGSKTIVRCENEFFDREKGLAMAICKKVLGTNNSGSNYYDIFKKWCSEEEDIPDFLSKLMNLPKEPVVFTIEQVANKTGLSKTTINRRCLYKDYPNAKKIDGVWWIPEADFQKDIKEGK